MFQKQADNIGLVLVDRLLQKCVPSRKSTFKLTKSRKLRILLKQDTALLSTVRVFVCVSQA